MPRPKISYEQSLACRFPDVATMWCQEENLPLTPNDILPGANDVVAWRCQHGHLEHRRIADQVVNKVKCATCTHIGATHPQIAAEVDLEEHAEGSAIPLSPDAKRLLTWRCGRCGHRWKDRVRDRCEDGDPGCRRCAWGVWQLGMVIESARRKAGLSRADLATACDLDEVILRDQEWGRQLLQKREIVRVAGLLHIPRTGWESFYEQAGIGPPGPDDEIFGLLRDGAFALSRRSLGAQRRELSKILDGQNVAALHSELAREWEPELNALAPDLVSPSARYAAFWKCRDEACGHMWNAWVANRTRSGRSAGCPECAHRQRSASSHATLIARGRSLSDVAPGLAEEMDPAINGGRRPQDLVAGTAEKVWWTCRSCDHLWEASVVHRVNGNGCPACWDKRRLELIHQRIRTLTESGHNLAKLYPEVAKEFDRVRNHPLGPEDIPPRSSQKVWWKGRCGHRWDATPAHRTDPDDPRGCPYCQHSRAHPTFNLETERPGLVLEWHPTKNAKRPSDFLPQSNHEAWWHCEVCGRDWRAAIQARFTGSGCGNCSVSRRSKVEIWLAFELHTFIPSIDPIKTERLRLGGRSRQLDILIPAPDNIVIEYDGCRYHNAPERDLRLNELLVGRGYRVLRIREEPLPPLGLHSISYVGWRAFQHPHRLAGRVLTYLDKHLDLRVEGLATYIQDDKPRARDEADAFIAAKKQQRGERRTGRR